MAPIKKLFILLLLLTVHSTGYSKEDDFDLTQLSKELQHNPKGVISKTELLIDNSHSKNNLSLRLLQLQAYVANDLDIRLTPKLAQLKQLANELNNKDILVEVLIYQAMVAKRNEHYSEALQYNYQALDLSKERHNPAFQTRALKNLAQLYLELEHYKKALAHYDEALLLNYETNNEKSNQILIEKGLVYLALGNYFQTNTLFNKVLSTTDTNSKNIPLLKVYLGQLHVMLGDYSTALFYLESLTIDVLEDLPSPARRSYFEYIARSYLQQGSFTKAISIAKQQLLNTYNTRYLSHRANLQKIIAQAYFQQLDYENAYTFLQRYNLIQQAVHEKVRDSKVLQLEAQFNKQQQESKIKLLEQDSALQKVLYENKQIAQDRKHQEAQYHQKLWIIALIVSFICLLFIFRQVQARRYTQQLEHNVDDRTKELAIKNQELKELSLLDQLTGLHNRRFLYQSIEKDISRVDRYYSQVNTTNERNIPPANSSHNASDNLEHDLTFVLIDLDHFKQVNDTYGHSAGDSVLVQMKTLIEQHFRKSDFFIRWGGEEFLIVARYIDRHKVNTIIERFRKNVAEHMFILNESKSINCTCSIGFASYPFSQHHPKLYTWEQVIDVADTALYSAKNNQRNAWVGLLAGTQLEDSSDLTKAAVNNNTDHYSLMRIKNDTNTMLNEQKLSFVSSINTDSNKNLFT